MQKCKLWLMLSLLALVSTATYASTGTMRSAKSDNLSLSNITVHSSPSSDVMARSTAEPFMLLAQARTECGPDVDAPCNCRFGAGGPGPQDSNGCNCPIYASPNCENGPPLYGSTATPAGATATAFQGGTSSTTLVASPSSGSAGNSRVPLTGNSQLPLFDIFVGVVKTVISAH